MNLEKIDLNHLAVFAKIAESGSLTKAAQNLGQPKSRVSRILSALEKDLGVQLIHRTTRYLQLTDIGQRFYDHCRGPLAGLEEATRDLSNCTEEIQGKIRITAAQDFGLALLPMMIDEFSRLYPKVFFDVNLSQESLNLVQESIDIAVRFGPLKDSGLKVHKVGDIHLALVATPEFLSSRPPLNQLSDLVEAPCLCFEASRQKGWSFTNGRERKMIKIKPALTSNNPDFLLKMALRSRGVALLPDYLCREALKSGRLVGLFKTWRSEGIQVSLVFPYQKQLPQHLRRFTDFLLHQMGTALGGGH